MLQLRPSGYSHAVVAMDTETLQYCAEQRPPLRCALWFPPPLAGAQTPVRTRPDIGLVKFAATLALLEMGHAVLFSEMDVFWVRDPLPHFLYEQVNNTWEQWRWPEEGGAANDTLQSCMATDTSCPDNGLTCGDTSSDTSLASSGAMPPAMPPAVHSVPPPDADGRSPSYPCHWCSVPVSPGRMPPFSRAEQCDLQISGHAEHARVNIGLYFARPTARMLHFMETLTGLRDPERFDQIEWDALMGDNCDAWPPGLPPPAPSEQLVWKKLDHNFFAGGDGADRHDSLVTIHTFPPLLKDVALPYLYDAVLGPGSCSKGAVSDEVPIPVDPGPTALLPLLGIGAGMGGGPSTRAVPAPLDHAEWLRKKRLDDEKRREAAEAHTAAAREADAERLWLHEEGEREARAETEELQAEAAREEQRAVRRQLKQKEREAREEAEKLRAEAEAAASARHEHRAARRQQK